MTETQKRIRAYKKALPHMRERVIAAIVLLLVSTAMAVSATFAWATLSVNPEVSGLATTIAANGNLEIALSDVDGLEPDASGLQDGIGSVTETNLKWGNLVNLSHESYGLDHLTLRPASLNTEALNISPMIAVNYGKDGRVQGYLKDFAFSNYNAAADVFDVFDTTRYGVRAISSVTYSNAHAESFYNKQLDTITESMEKAKQSFSNIFGNSSYMNTVTALVGIHVSANMDSKDISCLSHITNLNKIMAELEIVADEIGVAIVDMANLYLYDELSEQGQVGTYDSLKYELEDLKVANYSNAFVTKYRSSIKGLTAYVTMAKKIDNAAKALVEAQNNEDGDVLWQRDLETAVNYLVDMNKAVLKHEGTEYTAAQLSSSYGVAADILMSSETPLAIIKEGALKDIDQLLGTEMYVRNLKVGVTLPSDFPLMGGRTMSITVDANTAAKAPYELPSAYNDAYTFASGATAGDRGTPVAADTYAMAIDFWVRTNEANALLMLEGEVKYHEETIPVTGYNSYGQEVALYEYTKIVTENDQQKEVTVEVYWGVPANSSSENNVWVNADTHAEENVGSAQPVAKVTVKRTPIGYEGTNRVWNELNDPNSDYSQMIQGGTSTTQGSGSCYIFYPETPEDQEQCKNLLAAMHVAFVDQHGNLLGYADMDVDSMIEDAGRVILPLKMRLQKESIVVGQDAEGNDISESYYITPMVQNEAMRITAIIYLDGKNLSNSDVLSAGSINGQLNIQFGLNKMENSPLKDGELMKEHYSITANLINKETGAAAKFDDSIEFYDPDTCTWDLELAIAGTDVSTVRGQFVSYINASQGTRQKEFTMTYDPETRLWKASVPFSGPGEFRLRSIQIDGVDVLLPGDQILTVKIPGKSVSSVLCTNWGGDGSSQSIMTADPNYKQEVRLVLNSSQGNISKVQGIFLGDNGKNVTVDFTTDGGVNYTGIANFTTGGNYEMTYVIVDGVYTPLDESLYKKLSLKLNLRTTVVLGLPVDQEYYDLVEEMETAVNAAGTFAEKEQIRTEYQRRIDAHLNLLHYGDGISGSQNENGLNLSRDGEGNMSLITDASEPLFIDVRCIITDDQGNILNNLRDVELIYSSGSITNQLDSDVLAADKNAGYYHGRFTLESNGIFSFYNVSFKEGGQDRAYTIYSAASAPKITAIQPSPMEYVNQLAYAPLIYDLGLSAEERVVYVKLKNAAAASLDITLTNSNNETAAPLAVTASEQDVMGVTTFAVRLPSDGYWEITGLRVKNVFYDGTFYTGTDDPDTWLDLTTAVRNDEIGTCYITDATIRVSDTFPNQDYKGAFMTSHVVNGMYVEVLGKRYNETLPLEQILREAGIAADVTFEFQYALSDSSLADLMSNYSYTGTLPAYTFTSTYDEVANRANIASMNFLLPGTYNSSWTVTIDAENDAYDYSYSFRMGTAKPEKFNYVNTQQSIESVVIVSWDVLPSVTISAIAPEGQHTTATSTLGLSWTNKTVTSYIADDRYSAVIYPGIQKQSGGILNLGMTVHTYPSATLELHNRGAATGATMTFSGAKFYTSTSPNQNNYISYYQWGSGNTAQRYLGYYKGADRSGTCTPTGKVSSSVIQLTYGDVTFSFTLANAITLDNRSPNS